MWAKQWQRNLRGGANYNLDVGCGQCLTWSHTHNFAKKMITNIIVHQVLNDEFKISLFGSSILNFEGENVGPKNSFWRPDSTKYEVWVTKCEVVSIRKLNEE